MSITWLHISDFHIKTGDSYDRDKVLGALVKSIAHYAENGRSPDLIFATGDIAFSGIEKEYTLAGKFFDDLLSVTKLDKSRLFIIPGNHDVDRNAGIGLARTLASREVSDKYFKPASDKPHLAQKMRAFLDWHNTYFKGYRAASGKSTCGPVELLEIKGRRLGILPINSALFCEGADDHNNLWVGRRCLDAAVEELKILRTDVNLALVHHPLEWLHPIEGSNIQAELEASVHILLRGHLHEPRVELVAASEGELLRCAAGASYQTSKWPNRALYATRTENRLTIFPIKYEDSPRPLWTTDSGVFPRDPNHEKSFAIPKLNQPVVATAPLAAQPSVRTVVQLTKKAARIFISTTAIDLRDFREKVRDAILSLENLPIAMETFSAKPGDSATECMRMAAEADAVICIFAHRYGFVPPGDLGGDGERSITWLEVDAAKKAGKPVLAFLVDPAAPWTGVKEQDRLTTEPADKVPEIIKAVQKLQEFKTQLSTQIRGLFSNPDHLATLVTVALANLNPQNTSVTRVWHPLFCHALQPAPHFCGRAAHLASLREWFQTPITPDRVISIVAAGGTGKTALVNQALQGITTRAGLFVWSFYDDQRTDEFLRAAFCYFTGETDGPPGGMLQRLQLALSGDQPHILVIDGLELVQTDATEARRRGELSDLQLKTFVRALAGGIGATRAVVTSRFPLVDLENWTGAGHRAILLDDLDRAAALDVLRAWKVKGADVELTKLIAPLEISGVYHALSVAVLGSYIGNFQGGDPARAPEFSLEDMTEADPKARRLDRILHEYATALTPVERDLLARLTLFPRGVKVEILGWIAHGEGQVAGALIGLEDRDLVRLLERLRVLGLVFRYETEKRAVYSAHPFLRDFFRTLLGAKPEDVHESVRRKLAPSLVAKPKKKPSDPAIFEQYELLIEQTLLAGRIKEAFEIYWIGIGGFTNLGIALGDNARGIRILDRFVSRDESFVKLSVRDQSSLITALGLFSKNIGDISRARQAFARSLDLDTGAIDLKNQSISHQNLAESAYFEGSFPQALEHSERAVACAMLILDQDEIKWSLAWRGISQFALGNITIGLGDVLNATKMEGRPLYSMWGVLEAATQLQRGRYTEGLNQTQANRHLSYQKNWSDNLCRCNALLALLLAPTDSANAARRLMEARAFADRSNAIELQLRCFHAACELQRHLADYTTPIVEAEAGILLADSCGFGKFSIDLRLALAETQLAAGLPHEALKNARTALELSLAPECQYAWGQADGLHFCGLANHALKEPELARQRLTAALEIRERLGHGRIEETRKALALLPIAG